MVLEAADRASPDSRDALEKLCRVYWLPLYALIRRRGSSPEDAQDLTQSFFADVWFDIRGVVPLRRAEPRGSFWQLNWKRYPEVVNRIPLNRPVRRIHVLHGATDRTADGEAIGRVKPHYADGTKSEVIYGRHLRSWWLQPGPEDEPSAGRRAWSGSNPVAQDQGAQLHLYVATLVSPGRSGRTDDWQSGPV